VGLCTQAGLGGPGIRGAIFLWLGFKGASNYVYEQGWFFQASADKRGYFWACCAGRERARNKKNAGFHMR